MQFHSERGEDKTIAALFEGQAISQPFFVDVGAYDGVTDSNTHYFESVGWKGLCIEPHPHYFPICAKNRPNSECLNLAAWDKDGASTEFYAAMPGAASRIGQLEELKKTLKLYPHIKIGDPIHVSTRTLDTVFRETGVPKKFELLSVDVEGTEMNVLRGLTLRDYLPRIVIVEYNHICGERSLRPYQRPPQILYDYFAECGYTAVNNPKSHNVIFCRELEDSRKIALSWLWEGREGFVEEPLQIYVITGWGTSEYAHAVLRPYSPGDSGRWGNVEFCDSFDEADLYVVFWGGGPSPYEKMKRCPPHSVLNFTREWSRMIPDPRTFGKETIYCQWPGGNARGPRSEDAITLQVWGTDGAPNPQERVKHYSEIIGVPFPEKTGLLSWITTGDYSLPCERNRMDFMKRFTDEYPGVLDLYGRNTGGFDLDSIDSYKGSIERSQDAVNSYEYTFAFENACEVNYMSEKFNDAILAGCIPFYWGMTNIGDYYPEGSFVEIDITRKDAPQKIMGVLESDFRNQNLEALYKAKDLLLSKYQFWPALHGLVNRLIRENVIDLHKLEQRRQQQRERQRQQRNENRYIY